MEPTKRKKTQDPATMVSLGKMPGSSKPRVNGMKGAPKIAAAKSSSSTGKEKAVKKPPKKQPFKNDAISRKKKKQKDGRCQF